MKKIKKVEVHPGLKLKVSLHKTQYSDIKYPVFCFRHIHNNFNIDDCTDKERKSLLKRLQILSNMTWLEIQFADKHGCGTEKISQSAIRAGIPEHLSKDENLYALRFEGTKSMVGYRTDSIFHIVYVDRDYTLYNHG